MKRVILAMILAAVVFPVAAETKAGTCQQMHDLVVSMGKARDIGVPLVKQYQVAEDSWKNNPQFLPLVLQLIDAIYSTPEQTPQRMAGEFLKGCLRGQRGGV